VLAVPKVIPFFSLGIFLRVSGSPIDPLVNRFQNYPIKLPFSINDSRNQIFIEFIGTIWNLLYSPVLRASVCFIKLALKEGHHFK
jgi:hypothetical protein